MLPHQRSLTNSVASFVAKTKISSRLYDKNMARFLSSAETRSSRLLSCLHPAKRDHLLGGIVSLVSLISAVFRFSPQVPIEGAP